MRSKFTTTLDSELLKELKIQAIREGADVSKILEKLITKYLKQGTTEPPSYAIIL